CRSRGSAPFPVSSAPLQDTHTMGKLSGLLRDQSRHYLYLWVECGSCDLLRRYRDARCDPGSPDLSCLKPGTALLLQEKPPGAIFLGKTPDLAAPGCASNWLSALGPCAARTRATV